MFFIDALQQNKVIVVTFMLDFGNFLGATYSSLPLTSRTLGAVWAKRLTPQCDNFVILTLGENSLETYPSR